MANSSDWLATLEARGNGATGPLPAWLSAANRPGAFAEGLPVPQAARPHQPCKPEDEKPDPHAEALAQAYARGEAAGRSSAELAAVSAHTQDAAETAAADEHRRALRLTLGALDKAGLDALAEDLAATVLALCNQTIGDIAPDAMALKNRCEAAAQRLGAGIAHCTLHLHPEDAALLDAETTNAWLIVGDERLERGALRLESAEGSVCDGPHEWRRAIAAAVAD
jgi:flagellar assembly protein FliH